MVSFIVNVRQPNSVLKVLNVQTMHRRSLAGKRRTTASLCRENVEQQQVFGGKNLEQQKVFGGKNVEQQKVFVRINAKYA
jgi:hypothetical protein